MIRVKNDYFCLDTNGTTYAFRVLPTGQLEHLYYGKRIKLISEDEMVNALAGLEEKHAFLPGNTIAYDSEHPEITLEDMRLEMSSYGKGDIREPFVEIVYGDGSFSSDFVFEKYEVKKGKADFATLPGSYGTKEEVETLTVTLKEKESGVRLELNYYVYEGCDIITRSSRLINSSNQTIIVRRLMSLMLDLDRSGYVMSTFNGAWAREMRRHDTKVTAGKFVNATYAGTSSSRANPFIMLSNDKTDEDYGECMGFNLIYSGNHYEALEVGSNEKSRLVTGINTASFSYKLEKDEVFEAPEAVMTYSTRGFNGMSKIMHQFVREHIVRGPWQFRERPVLLNSWEANYFKISESNLLKLAKAGKSVGIELFVMDDGWFGKRDNDSCSLGDWYVNKKKLPNGLEGICKKINALGMEFGIWVEPEMVNVESDLYRAHPDWTIDIPGRAHSEGRNQRILDLCNPQVREYIIDEMTKVLSSANISYVKWDMNRIFSDYYSRALPADRQGEVAHRYVLGLYEIMGVLTKRFENVLFEGCSAGGNRFDLGILCYFPQIWASDNTDAICRAKTQEGYSYGYPMSAVSAHVSACPNHQTLRVTPLPTRFNVASFGVCGYECNLCDMSKDELNEIRTQIDIYKKWRKTMQFGDFYRQRTGNIHQWTVVSRDKEKAVGMVLQELVEANTMFEKYNAAGLNPDAKYHLYNREFKYNVKEFGDLINTAAPFHVKPNSLVHNILAKFVTMPGEKEDYVAYGDSLMDAGICLKQAFAATGYSDGVRHFPDFASRMYFMEKSGET